ncbi:hypothetical protein FSP39_010973 [Pinctada imbricata]|uniref:Aminopeptidase n=1 Tax=Pinctada imbricata TaxID=66713 RepID=A0AA88XYY4_PINIB|nr:hypothetical protein FSP39_010973 [Pinctada imbricata]
MGKAESFEFQDMGKYSSDSEMSNGSKKGGCFVSTAIGFVLTLLAACLAVGVGLIVHFASPGDLECKCTYPGLTSGNGGTGAIVGGKATTITPGSALIDQCKGIVNDGNTEICSVCPNVQITSLKPTSSSPAQATTTTSSPTSSRDVRLPRNIKPDLYTVELQPNMYEGPAKDFTFNGTVKIKMICVISTPEVVLHINKLNITGSITLSAVDDSSFAYVSHSFDSVRQFIIIRGNKDLIAGHNYTIEMSFIGPLKDDLHGLYLSSYKRGNKTVYIATTQFQATDLRKTFPCFDEPAIKAKFDITLVRKSHMTALSNMPKIASVQRGDDWVADTFQTTPPVSTYLLAFIISDFNYTSAVTTNNVTYRAWARPEAVEQTRYALSVGVEVLTYFEDYFNISFPLPKQDMIAIPDFAAGAMENWGLITYRETAMLYDPKESSEGNKERVAVVVSHELAHQWFGNLVTPSWWDDLWLNEGFASFVEYMGVDHVHKDWKMFEQFVVEDLQDVFNFDGLVTSHPVYVPVTHPDEINEIFDRISYGKGASIIRMMRFFLGEGTFKRGLTRYLNGRKYDAAFHDDLWFALGNQSKDEGKDINVKAIMDTWTLQMNFPVVMLKRDHNNIVVTQKRYLRDYGAKDPGKYVSKFNYAWEIPFTFTSQSKANFNQTDQDVSWMHKNNISLLLPSISPNDWIIGNVMQYGYYRVNYEESNWNKLVQQLDDNHEKIHAINRAQIVNDAWNLAKSGDLDMRIALKTVNYLAKEREYIVWEAALGELGYVDSMLERTSLYGSFANFMRDTVEAPFNETNLADSSLPHLQSYVRSLISAQACEYGIQKCIDQSKELFKNWMSSPDNNTINPSVRSTVYCTAIRNGGVEEWDFAYQMYKISNLASEKSRLMSSLACSRETWILSRYLQYALTPEEIRKQDATNVIVHISRNPVGRSLAWDFVRANWNKLLKDFGEVLYKFARLLAGTTSSFNHPFDLMQLEEFLKAHPDMGSGTRAFQQAIEKTKSNIKWMESNFNVVEEWLKSRGY